MQTTASPTVLNVQRDNGTAIAGRAADFYVVEAHEGAAAVKMLERDWRSLERSSARPTNYFQSYDWLVNWCSQFCTSPDQPEPVIVTIWHQDELVCLWPLMRVKSWALRRLTWLSEPHLQYGDVLLASDADINTVLERSWQWIINQGAADQISLSNVLACSPLYDFLQSRARPQSEVQSAAWLDISDFHSYADFAATQTSSTRRNRRKKRNKLTNEGELSFKVYNDPNETRVLIDTAILWKRKWLDERSLPSITLDSHQTGEFLASLGGTGALGRPMVGALCLDGQPIAAEIGFRVQEHYYSYLGAYDPDYATYSAGKIQIEDMVSWCIDNGFRTFDLLGNNASYKHDWSNCLVEKRDFGVSNSLRAYFYSQIWRAKMRPKLKQTYETSPLPARRVFSLLHGWLRSKNVALQSR